MENFTIRAAAERCDVSYQLMRKRVDRGTVRTVKRDGVRLIPRSELERVGLWPGSQPELADSRELASLRAELAEARAELVSLRPLPAQLEAERQARELAESAMHAARAEQQTASAQLAAIEAGAAEHAQIVARLSSGNVVERWRARRDLRDSGGVATAAPTSAPVPAA